MTTPRKAATEAGASTEANIDPTDGAAWGVARDALALMLAAAVVVIVAAFGIGE